jgi:hypothetical protein
MKLVAKSGAMEDILKVDSLGSPVLTDNFKCQRADALGKSEAGGAMYVVEVGGAILYEFKAVIEDVSVGRSIVAKALAISRCWSSKTNETNDTYGGTTRNNSVVLEAIPHLNYAYGYRINSTKLTLSLAARSILFTNLLFPTVFIPGP